MPVTISHYERTAKQFHRMGFNVIPTRQNKRPIGAWDAYQHERQTVEQMMVLDWQHAYGVAGICGVGDMVCLDFDHTVSREPISTVLTALELDDSYEWVVRTPGGGYHVWLRCPEMKLDKGKLDRPGRGAAHTELRHFGHYTILPGSQHPSGGYYDFVSGQFPTEPPATVTPTQLLLAYDAVTVRPEPKTVPTASDHRMTAQSPHDRYAQAAFGDELARVRGAREGGRNDQLNKSAYVLGQLVATGVLGQTDVEAALTNAALTIGLGEREATATIARGLVDGMKQPRTLPDVRVPQSNEPKFCTNGFMPTEGEGSNELDVSEPISPLDIQPMHGLALGWLDDYVDLMTELTASPREFHQLAALVTAATAIQRKAFLPMSFGNVYPNVYACIVAMSTVYGKSTAISRPRQVLQAAMLDKLLIPSHGSSEGLIKQLSITPSALMVRDEIGTLFGSDKVRYLKDFKQDLTALYDGYPYSRRLSNEEIRVDRPYLNILGATTPARFYANITNLDWQDGLLPRWLFVMPEREPDFDKATGVFTQHHADRTSRLAYKLMEIDQKPDTPFVLNGDAYECWSGWRTTGLKAAYRQNDENAAAIIGRYATYALKFAIILSAVNDSWGTITPVNMQTAVHWADNYKANVYRILSESGKHRVDGSKLQKVFLVIQRKSKDGGMTVSEIMRYANMKQNELRPCLDELQNVGAVLVDNAGRAARYMTMIDKLPLKKWG